MPPLRRPARPPTQRRRLALHAFASAALIAALGCTAAPPGRPIYTPIPPELAPTTIQPAQAQAPADATVRVDVTVRRGEQALLTPRFELLAGGESSAELRDEEGQRHEVTVAVAIAGGDPVFYRVRVSYAVAGSPVLEGSRMLRLGQRAAIPGEDDLVLDFVVVNRSAHP